MKRLLQLIAIMIFSLSLAAQTHEILRPTVDSTSTTCPGSPGLVGSPTPTNVASPYDSSGTSTSSAESVTGGSTNQHYSSRIFSDIPNASAGYTSLTVNINVTGTDSNGDIEVGFSLDSGSTFSAGFKVDANTGGFAQQTFSVPLSTSQATSTIEVYVCVIGNNPSGTASATVFDVWTDGVIPTVPNAPSGLSASLAGNGAVNLLDRQLYERDQFPGWRMHQQCFCVHE